MTLTVFEPPASADAVDLADFVELIALLSADRNSSVLDLRRAITRAGTAEIISDDPNDDEDDMLVDPWGDDTEAVANTTTIELGDREVSAGSAYPFVFDGHTLQAERRIDRRAYTFMLLLSCFGVDVKPMNLDPTRLFEDVSAVAAERFFGGPHDDVLMYQFGFPRRVAPKNFKKALDDLCEQLGEGNGGKDRPQSSDQNDARLDIVVSRRFPDRRVGQLTAFGQCAAGRHWRTKLSDLRPLSFCKLWLREMPAVDPAALFFVPFRVSEHHWPEAANIAGVVFDRCRIAVYADPLPDSLLRDCLAWTKGVLEVVA